jgi:hypothetical protein
MSGMTHEKVLHKNDIQYICVYVNDEQIEKTVVIFKTA